MLPYFTGNFGNPSSSQHEYGHRAARSVEQARTLIAEMISAEAREIVFTSGTTESNNLAIFGLARAKPTGRRRLVTTRIEHKAVLGPMADLEQHGFELVYLPIDTAGRIDMHAAESLITTDTLLVSVQAANNEIGTLQELARISAIAHEKGAYIHTDATQAIGRIDVNVQDWDVDLLSISSHKLYGPKGVGALYIRGGPGAIPLQPLMVGGGQEHDLRPGTINVPGVMGFGKAAEIVVSERHGEDARIRKMRDALEDAFISGIPGIRINGAKNSRLSGNSSLTLPEVDAEALIVHARTVAISTGSACTSGALEPSYVLTAIGISREEAYRTLRIGLGRFTTEEHITLGIGKLIDSYHNMAASTG